MLEAQEHRNTLMTRRRVSYCKLLAFGSSVLRPEYLRHRISSEGADAASERRVIATCASGTVASHVRV